MKLVKDNTTDSSAPFFKLVNDDGSELTPEQEAEIRKTFEKSDTFTENQEP